MNKLVRLDLLLTRFMAFFAAVAVIGMMLLVASDAIARQVFNTRIPFVSVIVANYFMVAIAFLPLALAEAQDRHISVDLVYGQLRAGAQRFVTLLIHVLAALTSAGLCWTMWDEAVRRFSSGSVAVEDGVSMAIWQGYFMLPAGFAMLAFTYVLRIFLGLTGADEARAPLIADSEDLPSETN